MLRVAHLPSHVMRLARARGFPRAEEIGRSPSERDDGAVRQRHANAVGHLNRRLDLKGLPRTHEEFGRQMSEHLEVAHARDNVGPCADHDIWT